MAILDTYAKPTGLVPIHPVVLGPLMRKSVSLCIAQPGIGKSTWAQAAAIAIRHERPDLIGERVFTPLWPGHVVLMAAEDPTRIVNAKLGALEDHHGLTAPPKHGVSTVSLANRKLFRLGDNDRVEFIGEDVLRELIVLRRNHDIGLIVIDTLSAALQGINESSAEQMQAVMDVLIEIANAGFCSVLLTHHANKVSVNKDESLSLYSARGSSVLPASVRSAFGLTKPTTKEAITLTKLGEDPRYWVKLEIVKSSYTDPATWATRWFRFLPKDLPAYDPRDQSQHTMSIGVLTSVSNPIPAPGAAPSTSGFATNRQLWDKLKEALGKGEVRHKKRALKGNTTAVSVLGLEDDWTKADELIQEWITRKLITIPNDRDQVIHWNGLSDLPPEAPGTEDESE